MYTQKEKVFLKILKDCLPEIQEKLEQNGGYVKFIYNEVTYKIETHCGRENEMQITPIGGEYLTINSFGIFSNPYENAWFFNLADLREENNKGTGQCSFIVARENDGKLREYLNKLAENSKPKNVINKALD